MITSPNFPSGYPNDEEMSWRITVEDGYQVMFYFTEFQLEDSYDEDLGGSCVYDFLRVKTKLFKRICYGVCGMYVVYSGSTQRRILIYAPPPTIEINRKMQANNTGNKIDKNWLNPSLTCRSSMKLMLRWI